MTFEVEKGIQVPNQRRGRQPGTRNCTKPKSKYPWAQMEVGDCFFVPDGPDGVTAGALLSQASRLGLKAVTRREPNGTRVWRTE